MVLVCSYNFMREPVIYKNLYLISGKGTKYEIVEIFSFNAANYG